MGTNLVERVGRVNPPEVLSVERPEVVESIHRAFLEAGSQGVSTNTFGANPLTLARHGLEERTEELIEAGVACARRAAGDSAYVLASFGPTGMLLEPLGPVSLDEAYRAFARAARAAEAAGADAILFETFIDIQEARQALLAAKDTVSIPVFVSLTFSGSGRMDVSGTTPEAAALILGKMGADAVGANCSLGPAQLLDIARRMAAVSPAPVLAQPNAGLPRYENGRTVFDATPEDYAMFAREAIAAGVRIIGGCCGSKVEHIREVVGAARGQRPRPLPASRPFSLATPRDFFSWNFPADFLFIGERINPAGKKALQEDIANRSFQLVEEEARRQEEAGAGALDVNVSVALVPEEETLPAAVQRLGQIASIPLSIDTTVLEAAERALRAYPGRAILNSVSARSDSLAALLPIARRYGAAIVGLALSDRGIAKTLEDKVACAEAILEAAASYGLTAEDILFDPVVLTAATASAEPTLAAIRELSKRGLYTVVGLSNVSHGLPERPTLNRVFAAAATSAGLSAAILDPTDVALVNTIRGAMFMVRRSEEPRLIPTSTFTMAAADSRAPGATSGTSGAGAATSAAQAARASVQPTSRAEEEPASDEDALAFAIERGDRARAAEKARALLNSLPAYEIISRIMAPAMERVGERFSRGEIYLPNVLLSAEAMKDAFAVLEPVLLASGEDVSKGRVVLATVEGDIHDIGKSIVGTILAANGYSVVDLGVDVPVSKLIEAVEGNQAAVVGLSCLMTTTLPALERSVAALKEAFPHVDVAIGGAVVTERVREAFGADLYAKDAMELVRILDERVKREQDGERSGQETQETEERDPKP
jgi:5-methyltetrahydrofolate--homocysteine methyltransferase